MTAVEGTVFVVLENEQDPGEDWPDGTSHIKTLVQGALADKVRARCGREGEVHLIEDGTEGGYSEYTVEWDYAFMVTVDGHTVYRTESLSSIGVDPVEGQRWNGFGEFMRWLEATR